jgi:hypothetical protein
LQNTNTGTHIYVYAPILSASQEASANGSGDEEEDEADRLTKRRSQIAAASRKSRAKRKHELTTLREANEELEKENEWLRMRLSALGEPTTGMHIYK